jgi:hypothetical protein
VGVGQRHGLLLKSWMMNSQFVTFAAWICCTALSIAE